MAQYQAKPALDKVDPVWARIRREAEDIARREPELATFIYSTILHHDTLEAGIIHRLAERLDHAALSGELIRQAYADALEGCSRDRRGFPRRPHGDRRPRSGDPSPDRTGALLQGLPRHPDLSAGALAVEQGPPRLRALSAKPLLGGIPMRHPSRGANRPRHFPRSRHRPRGRRNRGDRGRRVHAARRDAGRHRQGTRRSPSRKSATA